MRKRGYSDIDDSNLRALRLNTKASLSKQCEKTIKEVKDKNLGESKERVQETNLKSHK